MPPGDWETVRGRERSAPDTAAAVAAFADSILSASSSTSSATVLPHLRLDVGAPPSASASAMSSWRSRAIVAILVSAASTAAADASRSASAASCACSILDEASFAVAPISKAILASSWAMSASTWMDAMFLASFAIFCSCARTSGSSFTAARMASTSTMAPTSKTSSSFSSPEARVSTSGDAGVCTAVGGRDECWDSRVVARMKRRRRRAGRSASMPHREGSAWPRHGVGG